MVSKAYVRLMRKTAKLAERYTKSRPKKKGKKPPKREQAQMLALHEMGMSDYQVGAIMQRSPHTIKKYCESPMFTDPKFALLVEEYKSKELIDLTSLTISARARLHDLVPTMAPIEAIALMDRSFQQRRLLEGKSTENISSLRRIITEAHEAHVSLDNRTGHVAGSLEQEAGKDIIEEAGQQGDAQAES